LCATGTTALWLAPHAADIRSVERMAEAVADAHENARTSGAANAFFFEGTAGTLAVVWEKEGFCPTSSSPTRRTPVAGKN